MQTETMNPYLEKTMNLIRKQISLNAARPVDEISATAPAAVEGNIDRLNRFMNENNLYGGFRRKCAADPEGKYIDEALTLVEAIGRRRYPDFRIDQNNRFVYVNFIKWCHGDNSMQHADPATGKVTAADLRRGIYVAGATGRGKSVCLEVMLIYCAFSKFSIYYPSSGEGNIRRPLLWNNRQASKIVADYAETGNYLRFAEMDILGIQDLGQEPETGSNMGNRLDVIRLILESRGDDFNKITMVTSNLAMGGKPLLDRYGDRVASRMQQMFNYLPMSGPDRRGVLLQKR